MVNYPRWAIVTTVVVALLGVIYALPNFIGGSEEPVDGEVASQPSAVLPGKTMNLGLDLQGGSSLLLEVGVDEAVRETLESVESTIRRELRRRGDRIGYSGLRVEGKGVYFTLRNVADSDDAQDRVRNIEDGFELEVNNDVNFRLEMTEEAERIRRQSAVEQSIEIVRRRVDETGVAEPLIQQQGDDRILVQLPGIKDPERIKRLLGQTAKLNFHMLDETVSIQEAENGNLPPGSILLYSPEDDGRIPYVVRRAVEVAGDRLVDAQPTFQDGQPIVSFRFDTAGGRRFGELTSDNVGRRLAIVLDREVVSAPRIQSAIVGGSGIITGRFTVQEVNDLSLVLRAGALPAPLTVLEERTVGPGLGADSIEAGKTASMIGLAAVIVFISISYGLFGLMAAVALLFNLSLIVALLSVLQATLTLPGIAGIVLTIGMAVDANVLILERIREEVRNGRTPISAVDAGYRRALTTIIDSNLTTLIAAVLLFQFGTGPIKGFAVTLSIGILTSMFTALMLTRLFVVVWLRRRRPQTLPI
ncbi:MAG: protein translocase subunit SecD [Alphaproteobacteria bacterium]|nr:protein translocase subunit SecD [Alphaproteobacteria bacterium]